MRHRQSSKAWVFLNVKAPVSANERRLFKWKAGGFAGALEAGWDVEVWGIRAWNSVDPPDVEFRSRGPRLPDLPAAAAIPLANVVHLVLGLRHRRPGVVMAPKLSPGGALALRMTRSRAALIVHVNAISSGDRLRHRGHRVLARIILAAERFVLRTADLVIIISAATRAFVEAQGVPPDRIAERARPAIWDRVGAEGPTAGVERDEHLILCVARLVHQKGVDVLVRAMATVREEVPDAKLEIAGQGDKREDLEALADELGLSDAITFRGHMKGKFMPEFYARGSIVVLPSRSGEGLGMALIEAALAGCALVGSNVDGINETITSGESGELFPPDDPDALAAVLVRLLTDPARLAALAEGGRRVAVTHQARTGPAADILHTRIWQLAEAHS